MKKVMIMISVLLIAGVVFAQKGQRKKAPPQSLVMAQEIQKGDSVLMKEGSVWLIKDGKRTVVGTEITIGGTKVKADGSVLFKDGTTAILQEGDIILADGRLKRSVSKVSLEEKK